MLKHLSVLILLAALSSAATADADEEMSVKSRSAQSHSCESDFTSQFTSEQLERIHAIKSKYEDAGDTRRSELHRLHKQMFDALSQPNLDRSAVSALQSKISSLENAEGQDRTQMLVELHDVLTTEQKAKLRTEFLQQNSMMHHTNSIPGLLGMFMPPPPPPPMMMPPPPGLPGHFPPGPPPGPDR